MEWDGPTDLALMADVPERAPADMSTDEKLDELLTIMRPLAQLPALIAQAESVQERLPEIIAQLNNSPVLRMLGVKL